MSGTEEMSPGTLAALALWRVLEADARSLGVLPADTAAWVDRVVRLRTLAALEALAEIQAAVSAVQNLAESGLTVTPRPKLVAHLRVLDSAISSRTARCGEAGVALICEPGERPPRGVELCTACQGSHDP